VVPTPVSGAASVATTTPAATTTSTAPATPTVPAATAPVTPTVPATTAAAAAPAANAAPVAQTPVVPFVANVAASVSAASLPVRGVAAGARAQDEGASAPSVSGVGAAQPATPAAVPPVTASAATAPAAPAAAQAPAPLPAQLAKPIFSLAAAGHGEHVVTVTVSPENLGSVTVRAHVSAESMQVQLFAASDLGRDAVRAILPDLRKDLAGAGLQASLDLSSQNQPSDPRGDSPERQRPFAERTDGSPRQSAAPVAERASRVPAYGPLTTIDVMA
jgi:flagellar hook-length control protein FliK